MSRSYVGYDDPWAPPPERVRTKLVCHDGHRVHSAPEKLIDDWMHARGILHRDLKPTNITVTPDGRRAAVDRNDTATASTDTAEVMGAAVSCSRPVVDAKWLEKSRQVGSSGKTVKPKVYLACGISGAFQHLVGIKGNPFIVAINKNPKAPIFQEADVGIVDDLLEFLPELTNKIREIHNVSAKRTA